MRAVRIRLWEIRTTLGTRGGSQLSLRLRMIHTCLLSISVR